MDLKKYNCFVGTARGVVICEFYFTLLSKLLMNCFSDDVANENGIKFQKPEEASEVSALSSGNAEQILLGYNNGQVLIFDPIQTNNVRKIKDLEGEGQIVGLNYLGKTIVAARHDGIINLWRSKKKNYFDINLDEKGTLETMVLNPFRSNVIGTGGEHNDFKLWDLETHQCIFKAKSVSSVI